MQESEASRQEQAVVRAGAPEAAAAQAPGTEQAAPASDHVHTSQAESPAQAASLPHKSGGSSGEAAEPAPEPELPADEPVLPPDETVAEPAPVELVVEAEQAPAPAAGQPAPETAPEPEQPGLPPAADAELTAVVEAIVYVTEEPVTAAQIAAVVKRSESEVKSVLDALAAACAAPERGIMVREVAGGYKMATKAEHHEMLRAFAKSLKPPLKLSLAALETLAAIAYKQPITAPEIMEIRGVQGAGVLKTLLDRRLIQTAGRKTVVGKPILYKTSKEFLVQFGLKDLSELPTLKEFEELRRLAASEPEVPAESPAGPEPAGAAAAGTALAEAEDALADEPEDAAPADVSAGADTAEEGTAQSSGEAAEDSPAAAAVEEAPAEVPASGEQITSEDANAPGTAPEDSGERRGDQPAQS